MENNTIEIRKKQKQYSEIIENTLFSGNKKWKRHQTIGKINRSIKMTDTNPTILVAT